MLQQNLSMQIGAWCSRALQKQKLRKLRTNTQTKIRWKKKKKPFASYEIQWEGRKQRTCICHIKLLERRASINHKYLSGDDWRVQETGFQNEYPCVAPSATLHRLQGNPLRPPKKSLHPSFKQNYPIQSLSLFPKAWSQLLQGITALCQSPNATIADAKESSEQNSDLTLPSDKESRRVSQ